MWLADLIFARVEFNFYHRVLAPIAGTLFFAVGAVVLFVVSAGHWRVRRWPSFGTRGNAPLEPTKLREGRVTYFCADVALFLGLGCVLVSLLATGLYFVVIGTDTP